MTPDHVDRSTLTNAAIAALEREDPTTGPAHAVLRLMMEATSPATETEFFEFLVEKIATTLGVYRVFVTECLNYPTTSVSMLASWAGGKITSPNSFALAGTPCNEVVTGGKVCFYPKDLADFYPNKKTLGHQSYIGVPIFETGGATVIGHIAIFDKKTMTEGILRDQFLVDTVLRIFAERTAAEIQRMRVTRALRDNAENYRSILDNENEYVIKVDENDHLIFASPSYCQALGKSAEELLGTSFSTPMEQNNIALVRNTSASPASPVHPSRFESLLNTVSGLRWIAWDSKPIEGSGSGSEGQLVVVGRDVTEKKIAEDKLSDNLRAIAHVSRRSSLSELSAAIAHEINQPLASILTYAQACLRISNAELSDQAAITDALHSIANNAERAGEIIRRLKSLVRNAEPQRTEHHVNTVVLDVVQLMQSEASRHGIKLDCQLDDELETVSLDEIQIQQVMVNLIQNAVDSLRDYPQSIPKISITTENRGKSAILITVRDYGGGVSPKLALSLFDPFTTNKADGLGIGLAISKSIVEAHGGELTFEPIHPTGAQFSLLLPVFVSGDDADG